MFQGVCKILAGLTVFLLALKYLKVYTEKAVGDGLKSWLNKASKNRIVSCGIGAFITSIAQSSVATNMVTISFLRSGAISLVGACAIVIGTNIGTTITAQIVSLKFSGFFDFTSLGFFIAFLGFILSGNKKDRVRYIGNSLLGFGLIFIGIETLTSAIDIFKKYIWFRNLFLVKSGAILLLNGFFITAICQSSSVISSMLVVLASQNLLSFSSSVYLLLGANIGTCLPVIIATINSAKEEFLVAVFNIVFNILGSTLFFVLFKITNGSLIDLLSKTSGEVSRQIANFHTFFNLSVGLLSLPLLKILISLCNIIVKPKLEYSYG